jgi:Short C-terminal domain
MAARTAVVAGAATAVSGRVHRRQAARWEEEDAQQYQQEAPQQYQQAAPPPEPEEDAGAQLQNLAQLHSQGVLTDEEFAAAKAKLLGI